MNSVTLSRIEQQFIQLPLDEQIWLMKRLFQNIHTRHSNQKSHWDNQLAKMAMDLDIQNEIGAIDREFMATEFDGLAETIS